VALLTSEQQNAPQNAQQLRPCRAFRSVLRDGLDNALGEDPNRSTPSQTGRRAHRQSVPATTPRSGVIRGADLAQQQEVSAEQHAIWNAAVDEVLREL
jgi:hypothetical protein